MDNSFYSVDIPLNMQNCPAHCYQWLVWTWLTQESKVNNTWRGIDGVGHESKHMQKVPWSVHAPAPVHAAASVSLTIMVIVTIPVAAVII